MPETVPPTVPPVAAYADESVSGDGRLYTLTAAIVDTRRSREIVRGLQAHAPLDQRTGRHYFHTVKADEHQIAAMTAFIAADPGIRAVLTARAPVPARGQEHARQACLAELVTRLARHGVRTLTMDGRPGRGPRPHEANRRDLATVAQARRAGLVPPQFQVRHVDDKDAPLVWIADVVGWQARRAVEYDEPLRLAPLAGRLALVEARITLPTPPAASPTTAASPPSAAATSPAPGTGIGTRERREGQGARVHGPDLTLASTGGRARRPPVPDQGATPSVPPAPVPHSTVPSSLVGPSTGLQAHLTLMTLLAAQARTRAEQRRQQGRTGEGADAVAAVAKHLDDKLSQARTDATRAGPLDRFVTSPRPSRQRQPPTRGAAPRKAPLAAPQPAPQAISQPHAPRPARGPRPGP